jgi:uncharacterized protein YjdB
MSLTRQRVAILVGVLATSIAVACGPEKVIDPGTGEPVWASVAPKTGTLRAISASLQLVVVDPLGKPVSGTLSSISWRAIESGIVQIDQTGKVTSISPGTARIVVESPTTADTATIQVRQDVAQVTVSPASPVIVVGSARQLTAALRDANGFAVADRAVTWSTNASGVASVSSSGLVTAVGAGTAIIAATSEGQSGTASITVSAPVTAPVATVTIAGTASLFPGQTSQLTATLRDAAGAVLTGRAVTWTSGTGSVATVSANGLVSAIAAGSTLITATSEGRSGTLSVTVSAAGGSTLDTLFYDGFETGALNDAGRWQDIFSTGASIVTAANEGIPARTGARVMKIQPPGVAITHFLSMATDTPNEHIKFAYSMYRNAGYADGGLRAGGIRGSATQWGSFGIGGSCPDSRPEEFFALYLTQPSNNNWALRLYNYWLGSQKLQLSPPVCIGTSGLGPNDSPQATYHDINFAPAAGRWYRYEVELHLNTPGVSDGWERVWVDGVLKIEHLNVKYRVNPLTRIRAITFDVGNTTTPGSFAYFDDVLITVNRVP